MHKKILILLLSVLLTACANSTSSDSKAETEAVSETTTTTAAVTTDDSGQTTTTTKISVTSAKEKDTDVTTKSVTSASTTTTAESTTTTTSQATTSSAKAPANTTKAAQKQQPRPASTTTTTTAKPAAKPQPQSNVVWSQSMKVWRKLCEAKTLTAAEQEMIRSEIASYASKFQGKTKIHVSFATDSYDISYIKPIHLTRKKDMIDWHTNAHYDASVDMDCKAIINYAKSEQEIYNVVASTRNDALHLIDLGLFNRYEISKGNNCLEYASEITFNVGFDGTYLWFLTTD
ncbi:MAG: hypothetical protein K6F27_06840 [Ruminococcus sp.]|nr:hypothetical protein [Ruminococcus sp.]